MKNPTKIIIGALLCGATLLATAQDASAQRVLRFGRAIASPWYDAAPPLGPAGNLPGNRYYYTNVPTYTTPAPVTTTTTVTPTPAASGPAAEVKVIVHPNAEVRVNEAPIGQRGQQVRSFQTPPLERGWAYTYRVTAQIQHSGGTTMHERTVSLVAGEQQVIDFTGSAGQTVTVPQSQINR